MTVELTTARLAEIMTDLDGVVLADSAIPKSISPADIPAAIIMTDDAQNLQDRSTDDMIYTSRTYRILLIVQPWATGLEFEAEQAVRPFIDLVNDAFASRPTLENPKGQNPLAGIVDTWLVGDSGVINAEVNRIEYAAVEWTLRVDEIIPRTFA